MPNDASIALLVLAVLIAVWFGRQPPNAARVHYSVTRTSARVSVAVPVQLHACPVARLVVGVSMKRTITQLTTQSARFDGGTAYALFEVASLDAGAQYAFSVHCANDASSDAAFSAVARGTLRTARAARSLQRVTFAFGSCIWPLPFASLRPFSFVRGARDSAILPPQSRVAREREPIEIDFFVIGGDTSYVDWARSYRSAYAALWNKVGFRAMAKGVALFTMFDDHEYANDVENASSLARWPEAIDAWRLFLGRTNPSSAGAPAGAARHHDYTIESGAARVLVLDTFSHRSGLEPTSAAARGSAPCSLLGAAQRARMLKWLRESLADATARALFVVSPLPAGIGHEPLRTLGIGGLQEFKSYWQCSGDLDALLDTVADAAAARVAADPAAPSLPPLFLLSGDVHFSRVIRFDASHVGGTAVHEIIAAPLYNFLTESGSAPLSPATPYDTAPRGDGSAPARETLFDSTFAQHMAVIDVEPSLVRVQLWSYGLFSNARSLAYELEVPTATAA